MLLCGGGNAGNKIVQDGDSGWQRSVLLLLGPRHGVSAGAGGLTAATAPGAASWLPAVSAGQGWVGKTEPSPQRGQHRSQPAASTPSDHFPSQGWLPAWLMPFAERSASPVPGGWQARRNTVTSSFLTHLHALGIEGRLRAWSCFGRFLLRVGFLERHRAGICGGAG